MCIRCSSGMRIRPKRINVSTGSALVRLRPYFMIRLLPACSTLLTPLMNSVSSRWDDLHRVGFWSLSMQNEITTFGLSVVEGPHQRSGSPMKSKAVDQAERTDVEMLPEYDFRGAARGTAYRPLHEGCEVQIHKADGHAGLGATARWKCRAGCQPALQAYFQSRWNDGSAAVYTPGRHGHVRTRCPGVFSGFRICEQGPAHTDDAFSHIP